MHHATARGSVNGLVLTEVILMKHLSMRSRTNFNLAEAGIPKIVLDILCAPATDDVILALKCGERECVFEGAEGQLYSSPQVAWTQRADDAGYPTVFRRRRVFMDQP